MSIMIFSVTSMTSNERERAAFEPYGRVERLFFILFFFTGLAYIANRRN